MKWLLITNNGNPGDIWVRLGIQEIIRHFDRNPTWIIRERDYREGDAHKGLTEPKEKLDFDYSVVCGMPFLWSHKEPGGELSSTIQHKSWIPLNGWLKPEKMIIAAFGIYFLCPRGLDEWEISNPEKLFKPVQKLFDRCRLVYARSPLIKQFFPHVGHLHCPSVLAMKPATHRDLKLCNFMPGGSHYPKLAAKASEAMELQMPALARKLQKAGFHFVAHRAAEKHLALSLGWPEEQIYTWMYDGTGVNLLEIYARCTKYIGNRVHGGIMSRAVGAEAIVIGTDTRLAAAQYLGAKVCTPLTIPDLDDWINSAPKHQPYHSSTVRHIHVSWWSSHLGIPTIK